MNETTKRETQSSPDLALSDSSTPSAASSDVRAAERARALVQVLDRAERLPASIALRERSYELLGLPAGARVLDVGCGTGRAVEDLRQRGMTTQGLDHSEVMVHMARERYAECSFVHGSAEALPLEDASVEGYRAERVYHDLKDPLRAVTEAKRVLVRGARIVLVGHDWSFSALESNDDGLTQRILDGRARTIPTPRIARGYRNLLLEAGFIDVEAEAQTVVIVESAEGMLFLASAATAAVTSGAVSDAEANAWMEEQGQRGATNRFLLALPVFFAAGTRE